MAKIRLFNLSNENLYRTNEKMFAGFELLLHILLEVSSRKSLFSVSNCYSFVILQPISTNLFKWTTRVFMKLPILFPTFFLQLFNRKGITSDLVKNINAWLFSYVFPILQAFTKKLVLQKWRYISLHNIKIASCWEYRKLKKTITKGLKISFYIRQQSFSNIWP